MATGRPNSPRRLNATTARKKRSPAGGKRAASKAKAKRSPNRKRTPQKGGGGLDLTLIVVVIISLFSSSAIGYLWFFAPWQENGQPDAEQVAKPTPKKTPPAPVRQAPPVADIRPAPPSETVSQPPPMQLREEERISAEEAAIMREIASGEDLTKKPEPEPEAPKEESVIGPEGEFVGEDPALAMADTAPKPEVKAEEEAKPEPQPEPTIKAALPAQVARAKPLNPDEMTTERVAAYQVALERMHFSCGFVDGDIGMRTRRVIRAFQQSRGLPVTGELDAATRQAIGEPGEPFTSYVVTAEDMKKVQPTPTLWREKAKAKYLGYNDPWEMLGEKFHCTVDYIKALNPDVTTVSVGTEVIGPKVFPELQLRKADSIRIILSETTIQALDANGRIIAHFPCSIARNKNKRPNGELRVKNIAVNPDYTFSPDVITSVAEAEGITKKMVLPPGPNNPVGTAWVGLSLPGYGMHGTPEPEDISRTQSSGCFRLSNWNADKLLKMVTVGMPVNVIPPDEMPAIPHRAR